MSLRSIVAGVPERNHEEFAARTGSARRCATPAARALSVWRSDDRLRQATLVLRGDEILAINGLSFDLLLALLDCAPNLVTPDELMKRVWPGLIVGPETISQRVKLLRHALQDDARAPRYIAVVRGRGYRAIADVSRGQPMSARHLHRSLLAVVLALAALLIGAAAFYFEQASGSFLRKRVRRREICICEPAICIRACGSIAWTKRSATTKKPLSWIRSWRALTLA